MISRSAPLTMAAERDSWSFALNPSSSHDDGPGLAPLLEPPDIGSVNHLSTLPVTSNERVSERADRTAVPLDSGGFDSELLAVVEPAFGYALRLTRHRADAEDLVQEAALLACRGAHTFAAGSNFKAWFFRILVRCFYARHRTVARRPQTVELDDTPDVYLYGRSIHSGLPFAGDDPASLLLDRMGTERIVEAIGKLPAEYGVVCTLYFMEDFAYQEIAEILEVPVGTVRSRLHRGRKMLQKALWFVAQEAGVVTALTQAQEQQA